MARSFKIVDMKGDENEEAVHFFDQSWFKQLMRYALDSIYWGTRSSNWATFALTATAASVIRM